MELTKDSFTQPGIFSGAPIEREITWKNGEEELTATVFIRQIAYQAIVSDVMTRLHGGDPLAGKIAACICDRNGLAVFTPQDITGDADPSRGPLNGNLTLALLTAISEVNSLGESN